MKELIQPLYKVLRQVLEECSEKQKLIEITDGSYMNLIKALHNESFFGLLKGICSAIELVFKVKSARMFLLNNETAFFFDSDKNRLSSIEMSKSLADIDFSLENTLTESILGEKSNYIKYIPLPTHCKDINCTLELSFNNQEYEIEPELIQGIAKAIDSHIIKYSIAFQRLTSLIHKANKYKRKRRLVHWKNMCLLVTDRSGSSNMSDLELKVHIFINGNR